MDPRIAEYIRANRKKYTHEAITRQLVEAGHDRDEVERTWTALETPDPDAVAGEGFWGRFALILVGINLAVFVLVAFATGMLSALDQGASVILVVFGVALAIGALAAWGAVAATGPAKMRPVTALAVGIAIPLLFAFLIGGSCFAMVGGMMGSGGMPEHQGTADIRIDEPFVLEGSGGAYCTPRDSAESGFSVFSDSVATGGEGRLSVQYDAFGGPPGVAPGEPAPAPAQPGSGAEAANFSVSLLPNDGADGGIGYHVGPASTVEVEASDTGLSGSARFSQLEGTTFDGTVDADIDPLSGTFSWTCE